MALSEQLHSALAFSRVNPLKGPIVEAFRDKGILSLMLRAKQSCIYPKLMAKQLDKFITFDPFYKDVFNCTSKLDAVVNSILERKGNGCGKLVFCHFREEIDEIAERLRRGGMEKVATFDGRTSGSKRYDILNEKNEALILQIQTGCEGLNLQENYSEIYFISPHWNPAVEDQATDRAHRIGQTKPVTVYRLVTKDSIEEQILALHDDKRELIANVLNGANRAGRLSSSELISLIKNQPESQILLCEPS